MSERMQAYVGLVVAAFLFGATFVVVKEAVVSLPPLAFVGWRFLLGATVLFLTGSALFEGFPLPSTSVLPALIGTGAIVAAGAFLLQVRAQTDIGPSRTAIILSAEPLFAAATTAVIFGERLTAAGMDRSGPDHDRDVCGARILAGGPSRSRLSRVPE